MENFKFSIVTEVEGVLVKMERAEFDDFDDFDVQVANGEYTGMATVVSFGQNDYGKFTWNQRNAVACPSSQADVGPMFFAYCEAVRSFIKGKLSVYQQTLEDLNNLDQGLYELLKSRLSQDAISNFLSQSRAQLIRDTTLAYSAKKEAEELAKAIENRPSSELRFDFQGKTFKVNLSDESRPRRINGICL